MQEKTDMVHEIKRNRTMRQGRVRMYKKESYRTLFLIFKTFNIVNQRKICDGIYFLCFRINEILINNITI